MLEKVGHVGDGGGDVIARRLAWRSKKLVARAVGRERGGGAERKGAVVEGGKVNVRIVVDPGEALFDALNLEADEAVEDAEDGVVEDRAAKGLVEGVGHAVDEFVEGVVDRAGGHVDPAKDVVVDVVVRLEDDVVGAGCPALACILQRRDNLLRKVAHLVREGGHLLFDALEENVLAEAGKEAGEGKGENKERRDRRNVSDKPSCQLLLLFRVKESGRFEASSARIRTRGNVDGIHGVFRVLANEDGRLLLESVASHITIRHGNAGKDGGND